MPLNPPINPLLRPREIVKVQISIQSTMSVERQVLIYNQSQTICAQLNLSDCPGLEEAIADCVLPCAFFYAYVVDRKVVLDERAPEQHW